MLVNAVRDICGEGNFHFSPADISTDPSTAGQVIDSGFMMYFRDAEIRENAVHAVTGAGSCRTYQPLTAAVQLHSLPLPAGAPRRAEGLCPGAPGAENHRQSQARCARPLFSVLFRCRRSPPRKSHQRQSEQAGSIGRCCGGDRHYRVHGHLLSGPEGAQAGCLHQIRPSAPQTYG